MPSDKSNNNIPTAHLLSCSHGCLRDKTTYLPMKTTRQNPSPGFTLVEIMVVVVFIALLAAIAIPQFSRIRMRSQDAAVLNNVRQLASASTQYFLEYGVTTVSADKIIGATKYVKNLDVIASETYPMGFTQDVAITVTGVGGARTITYIP